MNCSLQSAVQMLLLASCIASPLVACASQPVTVTREPVTLRLVAADSCAPVAEAVAAAYEESRPWVTIESEILNNALAEERLRSGGADLALLSWLPQPVDESEPLWRERFGQDGVAVIVHVDAPLREVGLAHLRDVFGGRLQERGEDVITVVSREEGSGTRAAFESIVLGGEETTLTAVVMPSSEAVVDHVASTPSAIGYVSTLRLGADVRVLAIDGVLPTQQAVANGSYPLSRTLYLAARAEPTGEAREFAQWLLRSGGASVDGLVGW